MVKISDFLRCFGRENNENEIFFETFFSKTVTQRIRDFNHQKLYSLDYMGVEILMPFEKLHCRCHKTCEKNASFALGLQRPQNTPKMNTVRVAKFTSRVDDLLQKSVTLKSSENFAGM